MENHDKNTFTYLPTKSWILMNSKERVSKVESVANHYLADLDVVVQSADDNGHVVLKIEQPIPADKRGLLLLDLEAKLKKDLDEGITIWLEPVGDKSKLRQLRGVEVKS